MNACVPVRKAKEVEPRNWLLEGLVMVLTAAVMVQAYSAYEVREAAREQAEVQKRLIQRLDTDALITELALAHLEGREPSEKAKAEIRPIPQ